MTAPGASRAPLYAGLVFAILAIGLAVAWESSERQVSDVGLYRVYGERIASGLVPYRDFDLEYPPGVIPLFALPALVTGTSGAYGLVLAVILALVGTVGIGLVAACLRELGRDETTVRAVSWALALSPLALGALILSRFDLLPTALTVGALLALLRGSPRAAALVLGAAIAVKLYPGVLVPLVLAWTWRRHGRREALVGLALAAGVVALVYLPFLAIAPDGVGHSIGHQLSRPLQFESLGAGLLLAAHQLTGVDLTWESSHGSQNLVGAAAETLAVVLSAVQVAVLVALWAAFARGRAEPERLVRYAAAAVAAFVVLGKVLSPQFLVWLLFLVPLVAGLRGRLAGALYASACVLTALWFPLRYWDLVRELDPLASWLVAGRNALLVALLLVLALPRAEPAPWSRGVRRPPTMRSGPTS